MTSRIESRETGPSDGDAPRDTEHATPTPTTRLGGTQPSLGTGLVRGMTWSTMVAVISKFAAALAQVVLAWLLVREDFGKLGMTYTVSTIASVVGGAAIGEVLVQRGHRARLYESAAVWLALAGGTLAAMVMLLASPLAAWAYGEPGIIGMIAVLAASAWVRSLAVVPEAMLNLRRRFGLLARMQLLQGLSLQSATILLAWAGLGAYSFVFAALISQLIYTAAAWTGARGLWAASRRSGRRSPLSRFRPLWGSIVAITGSRALGTVVGQGDYIILAMFQSTAVVGLYWFAFNLAAQVHRLLAARLAAILFPTLAAVNTPAAQVRAAFKVLEMAALVAVPICLLQASLAYPVVRLLFPEEYHAAAPVMAILCFALALAPAVYVNDALLRAQGRFRVQMLFWAIHGVLIVVCVLPGAIFGGATGTALGYAIGTVLAQLFALRISFGGTGVRYREVGFALGITLGAALIAFGAALGLSQLSTLALSLAFNIARPSHVSDLVAIGITCITFVAIYAALTWWCVPHLWTSAAQRFRLAAPWSAIKAFVGRSLSRRAAALDSTTELRG